MAKISVLSTSNNAHFSRTHRRFWENNNKKIIADLSGQQGQHKNPFVLISWWWWVPGIARAGAEELWSRSRRFLASSTLDPGSTTPTSSAVSGALRLTQPPGHFPTSITFPTFPSLPLSHPTPPGKCPSP